MLRRSVKKLVAFFYFEGMKLVSIAFTVSLIVFVIGCDASGNGKASQSDTVQIDIPKNGDGSLKYVSSKSKVERMLQLKTLENGFDELQIRLWYSYSFKDSAQLIIFICNENRWSGEFNDIRYVLDANRDSLVEIKKHAKMLEPASGWLKFQNQIEKLDIKNLPDDQTINGYYRGADGDGVVVEIANRKKYRVYGYWLPGIYKKQFKEAGKLSQFLELIENEFGYRPLRHFLLTLHGH